MEHFILTGSTGFLGKTIKQILINNDVKVTTIGRGSNDIYFDLVADIENQFYFDNSSLIHCAGLAHGNFNDSDFYRVNVLGTMKLLNSIDINHLPKSIIFISSVAVYGCDEGVDIDEFHHPEPKDAYGSSKLKSEKVIINWAKLNRIPFLILRLPLIIGSYPKGNFNKIIIAIKRRVYLRIKKNQSRKSVVLSIDVANLILDWNLTNGIFNLTDGEGLTIEEIENAIMKRFGIKKLLTISESRIKFFTGLIDDLIRPFSSFRISSFSNKLTQTLTFSSLKARKELNWKSSDILDFIENDLMI